MFLYVAHHQGCLRMLMHVINILCVSRDCQIVPRAKLLAAFYKTRPTISVRKKSPDLVLKAAEHNITITMSRQSAVAGFRCLWQAIILKIWRVYFTWVILSRCCKNLGNAGEFEAKFWLVLSVSFLGVSGCMRHFKLCICRENSPLTILTTLRTVYEQKTIK